jgi:hypothetical protein
VKGLTENDMKLLDFFEGSVSSALKPPIKFDLMLAAVIHRNISGRV